MKLKPLFIVSAVTTPLLIVILLLHGSPLIQPATPYGIINLEMAGTVSKAIEVYNTWHPELVVVAMKNTGIDFLFVLAYTTLLATACLLLARNGRTFLRNTSIIVSRLVILAGCFDVIENILMFRTLAGNFNKEVLAATAIFAGVKFILLALGCLYILVAAVVNTFLKKENDPTFSTAN